MTTKNKAGKYWTFEEELVSLYLYKFGTSEFIDGKNTIKSTYGRFAKKLGRSPEAISFRFRHYDDIVGYTGMKHHSRMSLEVVDTFKKVPQKIHRKMLKSVTGL